MKTIRLRFFSLEIAIIDGVVERFHVQLAPPAEQKLALEPVSPFALRPEILADLHMDDEAGPARRKRRKKKARARKR